MLKRLLRDLCPPLLWRAAESLRPRVDSLGASIAETDERLMLLAGVQAALSVRTVDRVRSLPDVGFRVFSQFDEDGIIEWLVANLPGIPASFVEFGVEDYSEANTRFLLRHRNWRGLIMDGSETLVERAKAHRLYWQNDLTAVAAFIDRDNINDLIRTNGFSGEIGILSIDLDGNDYWIWQAITVSDPWLVIVEYNAVFGDLRPLTIPYDPWFKRDDHASHLYWGAGIGALERLAEERGYVLLGSNSAGNNAFFLRKDFFPLFEQRVTDRSARPSLYRESRATDGRLSYIGGAARRNIIAGMAVVDVRTGQTMRFADAGDVYSDRWKQAMGAG